MTGVLPEIENLERCSNHGERAAWLLEASINVLLSCEMTIRNRLINARFHDALAYLDAELEEARRPRRLDGLVPVDLQAARGRMRAIAFGNENAGRQQ